MSISTKNWDQYLTNIDNFLGQFQESVDQRGTSTSSIINGVRSENKKLRKISKNAPEKILKNEKGLLGTKYGGKTTNTMNVTVLTGFMVQMIMNLKTEFSNYSDGDNTAIPRIGFNIFLFLMAVLTYYIWNRHTKVHQKNTLYSRIQASNIPSALNAYKRVIKRGDRIEKNKPLNLQKTSEAFHEMDRYYFEIDNFYRSEFDYDKYKIELIKQLPPTNEVLELYTILEEMALKLHENHFQPKLLKNHPFLQSLNGKQEEEYSDDMISSYRDFNLKFLLLTEYVGTLKGILFRDGSWYQPLGTPKWQMEPVLMNPLNEDNV